jgi:two-component sensor histidine kinase/PAS domain-containing protein
MEGLPTLDRSMCVFALLGCMALVAAWVAGRASIRHKPFSSSRTVGGQARFEVSDPTSPIGHLGAAFTDMAAKLNLGNAEREGIMRALREGEERLQTAQDVAGLGVWDWDHQAGKIAWSPQMFSIMDLDPGAPDLFRAWLGAIHEQDRERMEKELEQLLRTLEPRTSEYRIVRPDGSIRWLLMRGQSLPDGAGKPLRTVIVNLDMTASKESEARERVLLGLSDKIRDLVRPSEILMTVAETLGRHLGVSRLGYGEINDATMILSTLADWHTDEMPDATGQHPLAPFGPDLCADLKAGRTVIFDDARSDPRAKDHVATYEVLQCIASISVPLVKEGELRAALYVHSRSRRLWTPGEIELCRDVAERTWAAVERARSDAHQRLLINELNHRVKNTLATVQSIAAQSFKGENPGAAQEAFEARLFALSKTHDVLTRENWEGANLHDIVEEALAPYRREGTERFAIGGARVQVPPRVALPLAMALHELSTNAAKYGAFSTDGGRVDVQWDVTETVDGEKVTLRWREQGGPAVQPPTRKGFGSRLIERGLTRELAGEVLLDYRPSGLSCTISFPLPKVQWSGGEDVVSSEAARI